MLLFRPDWIEPLLLVLVFVCPLPASAYVNEKIAVTLTGGQIEGHLIVGTLGKSGWGFLGIPYAEPPIGSLRFAEPAIKKHWKGVLSCHDYKPACWQNVSDSGMTEETVISEDCLYANVFVGLECLNRTDDGSPFKRLCPVVYYVHGGGYEFDSPRMFKPEVLVTNFASKGLVLVTVGYRLNVFGFWSAATNDALGNWALHDMVHGANWIQREIQNFGGDPSRVTIQGHSSSAMAVSLLTMSPRTQGLFHQCIIMSGTSCKRYDAMSNSVDDYGEIAVIFGCCTWSEWANRAHFTMKILNCLRQVDASILGNEFRRMRGNATAAGNSKRMTLPRIDGPNGLFPYSLPTLISRRRPLPVITGTVKNEMGSSKLFNVNSTASTIKDMCRLIVEREKWKRKEIIINRCSDFYVQNNTSIDGDISDPADNRSFPFWAERVTTLLEDDDYFAPNHLEASSLVAKGARVYLYSFDYEKNGLEYVSPFHAFDMIYVNGLHAEDYTFDDRDRQVQRRYLSLFVNFALYGNPTPYPIDNINWRPLSHPWSFDYLSVDVRLQLKTNYHEPSVWLWNYELPHIEDNIPFVMENSGYSTKVSNFDGQFTSSKKSHGWSTIFVISSLALLSAIVLIIKTTKYLKSRKQSLLKRSSNSVSNYESIV